MDPVEEITRAQAADLVDEDGHAVVLALEPGLPAAEIDALEREVGVPLPRELRALLAHTAGIDGLLDMVDFTGRSLDVGVEETFPAGLPIAHDGFGNFWVADLASATRDVARVFFSCHDAPVVLYQGPSIGHFLHEAVRMCVPPHAPLVDGFQIIDLRDVPIGMGFSWGRYGPRTELRRHGHELLFAYARPPKKARRGLFRRR